jgi:hypothetical protein
MVRHTILKLSALLALGVSLNVLVSWSCALLSPLSESNNPLALTRQELRRWIDRSPWPHKLRPGKTISSSSFGLEYERLESAKPEPPFWHVARAVRSGFPLPGLTGERWSNFSGDPGTDDLHVFRYALNPDRLGFIDDDDSTRLLPWRPVMPGFLTNTIFYAGLLLLIRGVIRSIRGHRRFRQHRCPKCNTPLETNQENACPSCGWRRGITNANTLHSASQMNG